MNGRGGGAAAADAGPEVANSVELRRLLFLVSNGDVPATLSQELYELAWENRIRPVDERRLKAGYGR